MGEPRNRGGSDRRGGGAAGRSYLLAAVAVLVASCAPNPVALTCSGTLEVEVAREEVVVGERFSATADHRSNQCLNNLSWSAVGAVELEAAEGTSAMFRATAEGRGTITVRNTQGQRGSLEIEVVQANGT